MIGAKRTKISNERVVEGGRRRVLVHGRHLRRDSSRCNEFEDAETTRMGRWEVAVHENVLETVPGDGAG